MLSITVGPPVGGGGVGFGVGPGVGDGTGAGVDPGDEGGEPCALVAVGVALPPPQETDAKVARIKTVWIKALCSNDGDRQRFNKTSGKCVNWVVGISRRTL